ncbi:hypothetical protein NBRC116601_18890 [Cognatishimia sp. WU-CL00825]
MGGFKQALCDVKQIDADEGSDHHTGDLGLHAQLGHIGCADDLGEMGEAKDNRDNKQNHAKPKGARDTRGA